MGKCSDLERASGCQKENNDGWKSEGQDGGKVQISAAVQSCRRHWSHRRRSELRGSGYGRGCSRSNVIISRVCCTKPRDGVVKVVQFILAFYHFGRPLWECLRFRASFLSAS